MRSLTLITDFVRHRVCYFMIPESIELLWTIHMMSPCPIHKGGALLVTEDHYGMDHYWTTTYYCRSVCQKKTRKNWNHWKEYQPLTTRTQILEWPQRKCILVTSVSAIYFFSRVAEVLKSHSLNVNRSKYPVNNILMEGSLFPTTFLKERGHASLRGKQILNMSGGKLIDRFCKTN